LAYKAGRAGAYVLTRETDRGKLRIVVGRDTRISGGMLQDALVAGINSAGVDVLDVGVMPTPAIAYLTRALHADAGVVVSASHNPVEYNGIKFFSGDGFKLPDEVEDEIERFLLNSDGELNLSPDDGIPSPAGSGVGRTIEVTDAEDLYIDFVKSTVAMDLSGVKILVDCANGSAYRTTPRALREFGAEVIEINTEPNGLNINVNCGSTHPESACKAVVDCGADFGFTHDGDADRVLTIDRSGSIVDGDKMMAICGIHMMKTGRLAQNTVVATVYSNLGLSKALARRGGRVIMTKAGDRYVLEEMIRGKYTLGGEQSGHIIFLEHNTTGDGLIAALQLLSVLSKTGASLEQLASEIETYPQVLKAVRVRNRDRYEGNQRILDAIAREEARLCGDGRVFVRPSGTEPVIRVMAEGPDHALIEDVAEKICSVIADELS
jgi:phosphoglucosamine mutase